jgi:hypothetical protein
VGFSSRRIRTFNSGAYRCTHLQIVEASTKNVPFTHNFRQIAIAE